VSEANLQRAREGPDRWNSGDVDAMLGAAVPDFEFIPAIAGTVEGGSVRGADEARRLFASLDDSWESFRIDADEFREGKFARMQSFLDYDAATTAASCEATA
jgi:ketosteroid isomerase-like protein